MTTTTPTTTPSTTTGALRDRILAGILAAGPALLILVAWHLATARPGFLEAISDGFVAYVPLNVFSAGIETFGSLAKGLLYVGIFGAVAVAGGLIASPLLRWMAADGSVSNGISIGLLVILVAEAVVLPVFRGGFFGQSLEYDQFALHVPLVVAAVAYGLVLVALRNAWLSDREVVTAESPSPAVAGSGLSRRLFIARGLVIVGAGSLVAAFAGVGGQVLGAVRPGIAAGPEPTSTDPFGPTPAVTPVADFYQVNKNLLPTTVDESGWRLGVDGLVDRPSQFSLFDLRSMPAVSAYRTLECISTDILRGDHLISNQQWTGVRVSDLLDRVGAQPGAMWINWEAVDGFTESIPIDVARHPDTWIAYLMGGAPLTAEHGFPARVLIPGRFGMKQPKWLSRMTLATTGVIGYWVERGWDEQAIVRTMSRIDYPNSRDTVASATPFWITGIANAGDRGISRVEISLDAGQSWVDAEVERGNAAEGPLTWVRWRYQATFAKPGAYGVAVRATDGKGATQEGQYTDPLPSGSTGWHRVTIVAT